MTEGEGGVRKSPDSCDVINGRPHSNKTALKKKNWQSFSIFVTFIVEKERIGPAHVKAFYAFVDVLTIFWKKNYFWESYIFIVCQISFEGHDQCIFSALNYHNCWRIGSFHKSTVGNTDTPTPHPHTHAHTITHAQTERESGGVKVKKLNLISLIVAGRNKGA